MEALRLVARVARGLLQVFLVAALHMLAGEVAGEVPALRLLLGVLAVVEQQIHQDNLEEQGTRQM